MFTIKVVYTYKLAGQLYIILQKNYNGYFTSTKARCPRIMEFMDMDYHKTLHA